jgi:hypothetical protein
MKKPAILLSSLSLVGLLLAGVGVPNARADDTTVTSTETPAVSTETPVASTETPAEATPSPTESAASTTPASASPTPTPTSAPATTTGTTVSGASTSTPAATGCPATSKPTLRASARDVKIVPACVTPDLAYTTAQGGRVEVYSSVGNNDGDSDNAANADWRQVNEFAYLISSVPKYQQIYATVYNSWWDQDKAKKDANGQWAVYDAASGAKEKSDNIYGPTQAFLTQLNQYTGTDKASDYVHVLGNKSTINDALNRKVNVPYGASSLASLLKGAGVMKLCSHGLGACLASGTSATDELMHAKYALFGQAKDSTGVLHNNVIWITSANLNGTSGSKKSNLSIALFDDASAYTQILNKFWKPEIAQNRLDAGFVDAARNGITGTNTEFTFYPSPRATDFEANDLKKITNKALGKTKTNCKVYAVHSLFSSARTALADGLAAMQTDKCDVRLVLGESSLANIVDAYFGMSVSLRAIINRVEFANVHDKTMAVSYSTDGGATYTGFSWAGSANFNGTSLQFDELAVRVNSLLMTQELQLQFSRLYPLARVDATKRVAVTKVAVTPTAATIAAGSTLQLKSKLTPTNPTVTGVVWNSSNPAVATVSASGTVTAVAPGTAAITVQSLSGVKTATSTITVVAVGQPTSIPTSGTDPKPTLTISQAPRLSMPRNPSPVLNSQITVTWSQGDYDIRGKVDLQWYSSSSKKWKHGAYLYPGATGRAVRIQKLATSRTWRVKAVSVTAIYLNGKKVTSVKPKLKSGRYSAWSYVTVRTKPVTTKIDVYSAYLFKSGTTVPFLVEWKNPYGSKYTSTFYLQYLSGKKWVTLKDAATGKSKKFAFAAGQTHGLFGAPNQVKSRTWRVVTAASSMPKGKLAKHSASRTIKIS